MEHPRRQTPLQTPHSGYHWNGRQRPFFEGWYYRLTLPKEQETLAFMYSIQDPVSSFAKATPVTGGAIQILGPGERYVCRSLPDLSSFWASTNKLAHGQRRWSRQFGAEGYRATATVHEGHVGDMQRLSNSSKGSPSTICWQYTIEHIYGWGNPQQPQRSTAGWLSQFQIFEPGWQVLMAHGLATGWFRWGNKKYEFERVPAYAEKNWGGAFPQKWFWVQCNAFEQEPDLAVTSGGGIRQVLGLEESVGMVGIHYQGQFYEFVPWNGQVHWQVSPWGHWQIWAEQQDYIVELLGQTDAVAVHVRVPTAAGLEFLCRDTTRGELSLKLWKKRGRSRQLIVSDRSRQAGLEVGGEGWSQDYCSPS